MNMVFDDAIGTNFDVFTDLSFWRDNSGGMNHVVLEVSNLAVRKKRACVDACLSQFPLAIHIESEACKMAVWPLIRGNH